MHSKSEDMKRIAFLLSILYASVLAPACGKLENTSAIKKAIAEKSIYDKQKESKISELKTMRVRLEDNGLPLEYTLNERLAEEYSHYQLDSAIIYIERNLNIANILDDKDLRIESTFRLAQLYSSYGLFLESKLMLDSIRENIPTEYLAEFYGCYIGLYDYYHLFSQREEHQRIKMVYRDSLKAISPENSSLLKDNYETWHTLLSGLTESSPQYSVITYYLAQYHEAEAQVDSAKYYYTISSVSDLLNSNKDQGSMLKLAQLYYNDREYTNAYELLRSTLEDAIKGNMKTRTMRISEPFTLINNTYLAKEKKHKKIMSISLIVISIFGTAIIFLLYHVYRQARRTKEAKDEVDKANIRTANLNTELMEQKRVLEKANFVQQRYIAHFFELSSIHLNKMESYQHSLRKLMTSGKMDVLNQELKSHEMLENELQEQHIMFDKIFLDLFPNFIEEFNNLFEPENRITLKPGELMNTEIRIYALIRVGFTDSAKIASFLHCSMSTIYTYRTKCRNRSTLSREDFEAAVMKIG